MSRKPDSRRGESEVIAAIGSLREALRKTHAAEGARRRKMQVKLTDTGVGGNGHEPIAVPCTVVITGDTQEDAELLAEAYVDKGWICQSSGQTEVTCKSPD